MLCQLKELRSRVFRGVVGLARIPCSGIGTNGILANPTTLKIVVDKALVAKSSFIGIALVGTIFDPANELNVVNGGGVNQHGMVDLTRREASNLL